MNGGKKKRKNEQIKNHEKMKKCRKITEKMKKKEKKKIQQIFGKGWMLDAVSFYV